MDLRNRGLLVLLFTGLLVASSVTPGRAQTTLFSPEPIWWSSPAHRTFGVCLGDVDGDGDLDLVCGNAASGGEVNTLYLNEGGVFSPLMFVACYSKG